MSQYFTQVVQASSIQEITAEVQKLIDTLDYEPIQMNMIYSSSILTPGINYSCILQIYADEPPKDPPPISRYTFKVAYGKNASEFNDSLQEIYSDGIIYMPVSGMNTVFNPITEDFEYSMAVISGV